MLKVTARGLEELKAAFKDADREVKRGIQQQSRAWAPTLVRAAQSRARDPLDRRIAASGRTRVTGKGLVATFGASGRVGRDPLSRVTRPQEFGTFQPDARTTYRSRRDGRYVRVDRRAQRQVPRGAKKGRFLYPALADATPQLVARYVKAIAEAVTDA